MARYQHSRSRAGRRAHLSSLFLAIAAACATACAPPDRGTATAAWSLAAGTVNPASLAWLDGATAAHATPLAGRHIAIAPGPHGGVIALTEHRSTPATAEPPRLTLLRLASPRGDRASVAPLTLPPLDHTGALLLASDGERYAAVAYQPRNRHDTPCPALLVDLAAGQTTPTSLPCRPHERLRSLTLEPGNAGAEPGRQGAIAYAGLEDVRDGAGIGRLVVVHLPSGAALGSLPLSGSPVDVRLAPSQVGVGALLYVLEQAGGAGGLVPLPGTGRLLTLDPLTLQTIHQIRLSAPALRAVPADGGRSIVLTHADTARSVDATTGATRWVTRLPGTLVAQESVGDRVYLASPEAPALWVLDVARGYRLPDRPLMGRPIGLASLG